MDLVRIAVLVNTILLQLYARLLGSDVSDLPRYTINGRKDHAAAVSAKDAHVNSSLQV